jgi:Metallo-beta-lactamase superfamily
MAAPSNQRRERTIGRSRCPFGTDCCHCRRAGGRRRLNVLRDPHWTQPLPIHAWAIEHPEGLVLVDTGEVHEASDPRYYPAANPYLRRATRFQVDPGDVIDEQLRRLGLAADQVRWVVLTHLHADHAGGLRFFPQTEIVLAEAEYAAARGVPGRLRGYTPQHWPDWLAPRTTRFPAGPVGQFAASHALPAGPADPAAAPVGGSSCLSSARAPLAMIRPSWRIAIRSASCSASSRLLGLVEVLRGEQHRGALAGELLDRLPDLDPRLRIESCGRLVEEEHGRVADQAHRDVEATAHPARVGRHPAAGRVGQLEPCKQVVRDSTRILEVSQLGDQHEVLPPGEDLVDGGELSGEADRLADLRGLRGDVASVDGCTPAVGLERP